MAQRRSSAAWLLCCGLLYMLSPRPSASREVHLFDKDLEDHASDTTALELEPSVPPRPAQTHWDATLSLGVRGHHCLTSCTDRAQGRLAS
jgi:hypothetical protein